VVRIAMKPIKILLFLMEASKKIIEANKTSGRRK
jgi:hypothetical protein